MPRSGFTHGVASGEPSTSSVLLWTRFVGAGDTRSPNPVPLQAEISDTADFSRIVARGTAIADPGADWTARVTMTGLPPDGRWFYRFRAPDGNVSPVGRTRTFAEGTAGRLSFAAFSCSNLPFGWFNAYAHAAADPTLDLAIHLGDYLYEYPRGVYPSEARSVAGRIHEPASALVSLADYRTRYAAYRLDPDLQALHMAIPMLAVWDDHEFADNATREGATNHNPKTEGDWQVRKAAAAKAWHEWMPVSHEDRAEVRDAGQMASFISMETRVTGRMAPVDFYPLMNIAKNRDARLAEWRDSVWRDPAQMMLGQAQEEFVLAALRATPARTRWQILVNSVPMGLCKLAPAAAGWPVAGGEDGKRDVDFLIACAKAGLPFNMDNWNGFPEQRARLLRTAQDAGCRLIVLSGDSHNAWSYRLQERGRPAGYELGVPSVTSPGFDAWFPEGDPATIAQAMTDANAELLWCDTSRRGYGRVDLDAASATLSWIFTDPINRRSPHAAIGHRMSIPA